jgi:RNA polymerase sigma factor (sigma-70 family)
MKKIFLLLYLNLFSSYLQSITFFPIAMQVYNETELVIALKRHESDAYRYLYLNYRGSLYNAILQIIPEQETASDVLQEVFVTIWQNIDKYDPEKGRLFTWLLKLTRNAAINKTRSKIYKSQLKNADIDNYVNYIEEKEPQQQDINQIGLRKQVHLLRDDYKNVVELSYYNGFTQEEIAKALNIPLGTVKTRLRNALIELRKQFV